MAKPQTITDASFEQEVLKSDVPVLVDFWAPWCGPCKPLGVFLEEIAPEMEGKLKICKINMDENLKFAGQFGVMSLPTLILFHKGEPVGQMVGLRPKQDLVRILNRSLGDLAAK